MLRSERWSSCQSISVARETRTKRPITTPMYVTAEQFIVARARHPHQAPDHDTHARYSGTVHCRSRKTPAPSARSRHPCTLQRNSSLSLVHATQSSEKIVSRLDRVGAFVGRRCALGSCRIAPRIADSRGESHWRRSRQRAAPWTASQAAPRAQWPLQHLGQAPRTRAHLQEWPTHVCAWAALHPERICRVIMSG